MQNILIALGTGAVAGFALGWVSHKKAVRTALSTSRTIRRKAIGRR